MAEISDDELEAIRQRKLAELQRSQHESTAREQAISRAKTEIETAMKNLLTADAWDQWNNAKIANEQNAFIAASELIRLAQSGQIKGKITKEQIRGVLAAVARQTTREFKIKRK
ncbi:TPA: DNA-binding protein [archaeon]|uniref:DNA-binding protein n=1 Tax=Candidatus Naiadarchaeum limnaeum TaxID=2756139 RepID=A0A832XJR3_9ARCH|nr:DNA-binding protein [Candidatus Naiadarchaeum limnaeum]